MRLYLDACCLNRPFDDQSQTRVHLESEAVLAILERVTARTWTLLSSDALDFELARIPDPLRRARTRELLTLAGDHAAVGPAETARAKTLSKGLGLRALNALHLACAETLHTDAFLTTDDRLWRACQRAAVGEVGCVVANPLLW